MLNSISIRREAFTKEHPQNFPSGWYAVAYSRELPRGRILSRRLMDQGIVVYRTESGVLVATLAHCPHLGGHFGHGGTVVGEGIRCPYHGFCFDTKGVCVSTTSYAKKIPNIRTTTFTVSEIDAIIYVYFDVLGRDPHWNIPTCETHNWSDISFQTRVIRLQNFQDLAENLVDIGHFATVHRYTETQLRKPFVADGPSFRVGYAATVDYATSVSNRLLSRLRISRTPFENEITAFGLGYARVEVIIPLYRLQYRVYVLTTPISDGLYELRTALSVKLFPDAQDFDRWTIKVARRLFSSFALAVLSYRFHRVELPDDLMMLENKKYLEKPGLVSGDGPFALVRRWARQFYVGCDNSAFDGVGAGKQDL